MKVLSTFLLLALYSITVLAKTPKVVYSPKSYLIGTEKRTNIESEQIFQSILRDEKLDEKKLDQLLTKIEIIKAYDDSTKIKITISERKKRKIKDRLDRRKVSSKSKILFVEEIDLADVSNLYLNEAEDKLYTKTKKFDDIQCGSFTEVDGLAQLILISNTLKNLRAHGTREVCVISLSLKRDSSGIIIATLNQKITTHQ